MASAIGARRPFIRNETESRNFEASVRMTRDNFERMYKCKIFLHSENMESEYGVQIKNPDERLLLIYHPHRYDSSLRPTRSTKPTEMRIFRRESRIIRDSNIGSSRIKVKVVDQGGYSLAAVDIYNNLHFCDFIHHTCHFPLFYELVNEFWGKPEVSFKEDLMRQLKAVPKELIKEVLITSEFNKEQALEEVLHESEKVLAFHKEIMASEAKNIKIAFDLYRDNVESRLATETAKAFNNGVHFLKNSKKWAMDKADPNYLRYTERILAKEIRYQDKVVKIKDASFFIEGLRVRMESPQKEAKCTNSMHPNATHGGGSVCIGDLAGSTFLEVINKLPKVLELANCNSPLSSHASAIALDIWQKNKEKKKPHIMSIGASRNGENVDEDDILVTVPVPTTRQATRRTRPWTTGGAAPVPTPIMVDDSGEEDSDEDSDLEAF